MNTQKAENIVGAMALTLSDALLNATRKDVPPNISAAGLTLIGHVQGISIHELSLGLGLSHPGAVRMVDRMVADGFVKRGRSTSDGRAVALFLTPSGLHHEQTILKSRRHVLGKALSILSEDERIALAAISEKLITALVTDEGDALKICRLCDSKACESCPIDAALLSMSED